MAKVSIIIPIYNVEKYLRECLDSVINQTLKDIEIICVNDGSTDGSLDILKEYAQKDSRIKVINKENGGLSSARNAGLDNITGDYVYFLDSDDYIEHTLLESAMDIFDNFDVDYLAFGAKAFCKEKSTHYLDNLNEYIRIKRKGVFNLTFDIGLNTNIHVCMKIFKKSLIQKYKIRFVNNLLYEDIYFMWYYFFVSTKAYFDDRIYYHYRVKPDSIMETTTKNKTFKTGIDHLYNWHELMLSFEHDTDFCKKHFDELFYLLNLYKRRTIKMVPRQYKKKVLKISHNYQKELFKFYPSKKYHYFLHNIFSFKNSFDNRHYLLTFCGIKLKIKKRGRPTKKILVTGGAGFIGSHIVDKLIEKKYQIVVVDNLSSGSINNLQKSDLIKLYQLHLEKSNLERIFKKEKPDYVIHLAAQTSVNYSIANTYFDADMNIMSTIRLLDLCKKYNVKKFLTSSSAAVYGNPQYLPIDENHITEPLSPYGLSKLTMEKYIKLSGVPYIIFRFSNAYGPRQKFSKESGVIAIFHDAMLNNKPITIYGDGEQIRDFIYVEDIANICVKGLESSIKNETINISTNVGVTLNELFSIMKNIYGYKQNATYKPERVGDIRNSILDNKKNKKYFSYKYKDIKTGLLSLSKEVMNA